MLYLTYCLDTGVVTGYSIRGSGLVEFGKWSQCVKGDEVFAVGADDTTCVVAKDDGGNWCGWV